MEGHFRQKSAAWSGIIIRVSGVQVPPPLEILSSLRKIRCLWGRLAACLESRKILSNPWASIWVGGNLGVKFARSPSERYPYGPQGTRSQIRQAPAEAVQARRWRRSACPCPAQWIEALADEIPLP